MRKITLLCVGKLKEPHWRDAQSEFLIRLSTNAKIDIVEVAPEHASATVPPAKAKAAEADRLLARLDGTTDVIIAMDEHGKRMTSKDFASMIDAESEGGRGLTFVIGGTEGLDGSVLERANRTIALSELTFTHEMARIFLLEQLYRAEQILKGGPYHR